jgi:cytochrome P450
MKEWHEAVAAKQAGADPGAKWGPLDDISQIMQDRVRVWVEHHASETLQKTNDVSVLWGVNVNSNKNVFWMLLQIYTRPELLSSIRDEIAPYVRPSSSGERGPHGFPKLQIDVEGLTKRCPLLKAAFHETMRMNMSGLGIRQVIKDITIKESPADAAMFGKKRAQAYTIPAGSTLVLANGTMQMDSRIFEAPHEFRPERFIEEGPDGAPRVHMRNLNTFGGGLYKCKGRYFAEKEVLIFAAGLLAMWDVGAVGTGEGQDIRIPEMGTAGASRSPKEDVRVRLVRRFN